MEVNFESLVKQISSENSVVAKDCFAVLGNPSGGPYFKDGVLNGLSIFIVCHYGSFECIADGLLLSGKPSSSITLVSNTTLSSLRFSADFKGTLSFMTTSFSLTTLDNHGLSVKSGFLPPRVTDLTPLQLEHSKLCLDVCRCIIQEEPIEMEDCLRSTIRSSFVSMFGDSIIVRPELTRNQAITQRFIDLIAEDGCRNGYSDYYAAKISISTKQLSRIVRKTMGATPGEVIQRYKIKKAKELLSKSSPVLTEAEVGERLGYSSVSAFARFFKERTSLSPSEYRLSIH